MRSRPGLQVTTVIIVGLVALILSWFGVRWWVASGHSIVDPGWWGLVAMVFLGGGIIVAGTQVRNYRDGRSGVAMTALRAARTLVLGQAAALTGAALAGWYTGNVLVLLPDADIDSQLSRIWVLLAHAVVAVLLAVAGMLVQRWCRVRPRHDDDDDENGSGRR
jgi:hypothetical protein